MKKVNVKYYVQSFEQFSSDLQRILEVFSDNQIFHLEINLIMDTLNSKDVGKIVNCIEKNQIFKEITSDIIYTLIATVSPTREISKIFMKVRKMLSRIDLVATGKNDLAINEAFFSLQKKKLPCSLLIRETDFSRVISIYQRNAALGIPVFAEGEIYCDDEFLFLFKKWIYDKNGCRINIFADILSRILLDYWGTKCQYKSCLAKNFLIDADGTIYACKNYKNRICNLWEVHSLNEILSHENFIALLERSIIKRGQCKAACEFYELCQGGCILNAEISVRECNEKKLFVAMKSVMELLYQVICNSDYRDLNPAVQAMILSSVASNKIFEKGIIT